MCKSWKTHFISILIPLSVGGASSLLSMNGMLEYKLLEKPPLSPPGIVFPIVWTILFVLMGISASLVYCSRDVDKNNALKLYAAQLVVNFFWPIFFFALRWRLFSFFWILLLITLVTAMIRRFRSVSSTAGILQIPYLIWLIFAAYLNLGVYYLNR